MKDETTTPKPSGTKRGDTRPGQGRRELFGGAVADVEILDQCLVDDFADHSRQFRSGLEQWCGRGDQVVGQKPVYRGGAWERQCAGEEFIPIMATL